MRIPILLFFIFLNSLGNAQTIGNLSVTSDVYDSYTLFTTHTKAYLVDNCGRQINTWTSDYLPGNSVYLLPNGNLLRAGRPSATTGGVVLPGAGGVVELFDWDGNLIWSWLDEDQNSRQHHDVYPLPNGNILILAATIVSEADAIQAGRDPNLISSDGNLYNERIYEVQPIGVNGPVSGYDANIVWEWNIMDHLVQDYDATKDNFGVVAGNPRKLDINFLNGQPVSNNWLHLNSIQYDEEFDQIVISSRTLSEIWIIDHNTTTAEAQGIQGDFLYRWGNPQSYDQGTEADRKLYGQHTAYYIPSGMPNERKIMLFNNGAARSPNYSEVIIIDPPVDINGNYSYTINTAYGPNNTFFRYPESAPSVNSEFYSPIVSSARQLPNGNILVCEGIEAYFFEINPDNNNEVVWEYISPVSNTNGTVYDQGSMPSDNFTFRATKYSKTYSAFNGRDLTPGNPIENNSDISSCLVALNDNNYEISELSISPNPTKNIIHINSSFPIDKIEFYNVTGQKVSELEHSDTIDLSNFRSGIYFIKLYTNGNVIKRRIIKN